MRVNVGGSKVHITFESLMWFMALTAAGTVIGMIAYDYVVKYFPSLASGADTASNPRTFSATCPKVIFTQTPSVGRISRIPYARKKVST